MIQVGGAPLHIGEIILQAAADAQWNIHQNKFGEDYRPDAETLLIDHRLAPHPSTTAGGTTSGFSKSQRSNQPRVHLVRV